MDAQHQTTSRRAVIAAAVAGTAALVAERMALPGSTAAADGDPLILGSDNECAGFTTLRNTTAGIGAALEIRVLGGGGALVGDSQEGGGVAGISHATRGVGVTGVNHAAGIAVSGLCNEGTGVFGNTSSGVAILAETGFGGGGVALEVAGPVKFGTSVLATIPARARKVTTSAFFGIDDERLNLTTDSKVYCTLMSDPGTRTLKYVSVDPATDTFTVNLSGPVKKAVKVACLVVS